MSDKPEPTVRLGSISQVKTPPIARPDGLPIQVLIRGDAMHDPRATALADDIKRLVQGFLQRSPEIHKKVGAYEPQDDLQIAIHGLGLKPEAHEDLMQQISALVRNTRGKQEPRS
jgi:hypothetical protein